MQQKPFFLKSRDRNLYGVLFTPTSHPPERVMLFCHPLFEEKKASHRVLVELGRQLAKTNTASLMLDFTCCGDSEGDINDFTTANWLADIQAGTDYLKEQFNQPDITLLGIRIGASIATLFASKNKDIKKLILIDPVINGEAYLEEVLQQKYIREMMTFGQSKSDKNAFFAELGENGQIDIDGIMISADFVESAREIDLDEIELEGLEKIFLIQQSPKKNLLPLYGELQKNCSALKIQLDLGLLKVPPFWKAVDMADFNTVCEAIIKWEKAKGGKG